MAKGVDTLVNFDGEERFLIGFPVGDWSNDGHGKCIYYNVLSKKSAKKVREAHFKAKEVVGIDIGRICSSYEENTIGEDILDKLRESGYKMGDDFYSDFVTPDNIIDIWLFLLNKIDPSLNLKILNVPSINFYGFDKKERRLKTPGYGCFL